MVISKIGNFLGMYTEINTNMSCHILCCFEQVLEFQEILVQIQDSLSQTEVLELTFLCSDILRKDLSSVITARDLFSLLQNHDLLSSDNVSLLVELLKIIKRDKLIRDLQLNPQLTGSCVSPYRSVQLQYLVLVQACCSVPLIG